jgi:hypothetical protein
MTDFHGGDGGRMNKYTERVKFEGSHFKRPIKCSHVSCCRERELHITTSFCWRR